MVKSAPREARAGLALLAACALWGMSFPVMKTLNLGASTSSPGIDGVFVAALMVLLRFGLAAVVLIALRPIVPSRGELVQGLVLGFVTGLGMLLQTDGLSYTQASTSAFLTQGYVVLLPIVSFVTTRRLPSTRVVCCALLVLVGLAVLAQFDPRHLGLGRGELETLAAAVCFTAQILLLDVTPYRSNRAEPVTTTMFAAIALLLVPVVAFTARSATDFTAALSSRGAFWMLAVIVALPTLCSFTLMNRYQKHVTPSEAGIIYASEPVFASSLALFLPALLSAVARVEYGNEHISARLLIGGGLVVVANVLLALSSDKGRSAEAA
ncbi:MAG TPA: DMT family transporter [Polyangiaceae bacterium]|jgi:drug/metabolite transporter (DMT)-like permease|nr:DMT family transporter [Polyangiaceae bacterium]